jgi:Protein kinase domain
MNATSFCHFSPIHSTSLSFQNTTGPSSPNKTTSPSLQLPSSPSPTHNTVQNHETSSGGSRDRLGSSVSDDGSDASSGYRRAERLLNNTNPKSLTHSTSKIGLDELIEDRRADGNLRENVVHLEVPFGKPIEEVYDGVHTGPVLGSGISGTVRLVTHKATGIKYAVKVLDLGLVDNGEGLRQLREEIFIMCQLDHPNIVRLEEVYESVSEIYLVQELCLGGELFDRLDEQPDYHYTEAECARLVKQMLCAVRYLHSKGIIHRDLKVRGVAMLLFYVLVRLLCFRITNCIQHDSWKTFYSPPHPKTVN